MKQIAIENYYFDLDDSGPIPIIRHPANLIITPEIRALAQDKLGIPANFTPLTHKSKITTINIENQNFELDFSGTFPTIYYPSSMTVTPHMRQIAQDKLGVPATFATTLKLTSPSASTSSLKLKPVTNTEKVSSARVIVNTFLNINSISPIYNNIAEIKFISDLSEWRAIVRREDFRKMTNESIDTIEAITTPNIAGSSKPPVPSAKIYINSNNHSIGTIVHEIFHTISDTTLTISLGRLEEGVTEYITCKAMNILVRKDKKGYPIYDSEVQILRDKVKAGELSEQDILEAYFFGRDDKKDKLWKLYKPHIK
jgi:predicted Rdx family selenoprotein